MSVIINLGIFLALLAIGYVFGRLAEQRHFKHLARAEAELADILSFAERHPPAVATGPSQMVLGSVVIGQDYFKSILAGLRGIFGGRIGAYETLMDRARREALVRMKAAAKAQGANMVTNVKFSTARLSRGMEVVAYGTACLLPQQHI